MNEKLDPSKGVVCEHCLLHHECKRLCVMSPSFISVEEARKRLKGAKMQLDKAIQSRQMSEDQAGYLKGILDRGKHSCEQALVDADNKNIDSRDKKQ